jgi:hypothetical protein
MWGKGAVETIMPVDNGRVYPILVDAFGNPAPIRRMRERIVVSAFGEVLEIGAGSGATSPFTTRGP